MTDAQAELFAKAGGYLRNTVRDERTCSVCTTLVFDGYRECYPCGHSPGRPDLVVPLAYGVQGTQSATLLRHYKDSPVASTRQRLSGIIWHLLYLGITNHEDCIGRVVGQPVSMRMAVPSLSGRHGMHPFVKMAQDMNAVSADAPALVRAPTATTDRVTSGDQFELEPGNASLSGHHVLVLDDTWTQGSRTRSATMTLKSAGATKVSVMVIGRWLVPGYRETTKFVQGLTDDYNPSRCPVTGDACP